MDDMKAEADTMHLRAMHGPDEAKASFVASFGSVGQFETGL